MGICLSKEKTAQMGKLLKQVYRGELDVQKSVDLAYFEVQSLFNGSKDLVIAHAALPAQEALSFGACPKCGGSIVLNKFGNYSCSNWKNGCKYTIYGTVSGKKLTNANVKDLLSKGITREIKGFKSKSGKTFSAQLILDEVGKTKFYFPQQK